MHTNVYACSSALTTSVENKLLNILLSAILRHLRVSRRACYNVSCCCVRPSNRLTLLSSAVKCRRQPAPPELPLVRASVDAWSEGCPRSLTKPALLSTCSQRTGSTSSTTGRRRRSLISSNFAWGRASRQFQPGFIRQLWSQRVLLACHVVCY